MKQMTAKQLLALYVDTLTRATSRCKLLSEDELSHNLFEEFSCGAQSFLHDDALTRLHNASLITERDRLLSCKIRKMWFEFEKTEIEITDLKKSEKWNNLFSMCDELILTLNSRKDCL